MTFPHTTQEALVRYEPGSFSLLQAGTYVRCAVTNLPIPLHELKYWNVQRQEAYVSTQASLKRHLESLSQK